MIASSQDKLPNLQDFGISQSRGFLSDEPPPTGFADPYFHPWDLLITSLPSLVSTHAIRREIQTLPLLDASRLSTDLEHQRAYVVLAFLIHAYVWTGDSEAENKPEPVVSPQLAEPFLYVCKKVGLQPVLSYAGLCIWNWQVDGGITSDEHGFFSLEQLRSVGSFTGSRGEDAFYHVPVLVEAEGGPLIHLLLSAIQNGDSVSLISALITAGATLTRMTRHLPKLYPVLDADMFYNTLRPFLAGGKDLPPCGGVVFQKSDGTEEVVACIGGSAAQSSLFQFLDVVLGTEHKAGPGVQRTLFEEMRSYMPRKHRQFLEEVAKLPTIRSIVEQHPEDTELTQAYNECMKTLRTWRSTHIAVVSKYIISPARRAEGELLGTAGSALVPFLRQTRDETVGVER